MCWRHLSGFWTISCLLIGWILGHSLFLKWWGIALHGTSGARWLFNQIWSIGWGCPGCWSWLPQPSCVWSLGLWQGSCWFWPPWCLGLVWCCLGCLLVRIALLVLMGSRRVWVWHYLLDMGCVGIGFFGRVISGAELVKALLQYNGDGGEVAMGGLTRVAWIEP